MSTNKILYEFLVKQELLSRRMCYRDKCHPFLLLSCYNSVYRVTVYPVCMCV